MIAGKVQKVHTGRGLVGGARAAHNTTAASKVRRADSAHWVASVIRRLQRLQLVCTQC